MKAPRRSALGLLLALMVAFWPTDQNCAAETIKVGMLKVTASGPIVIAQEKGYFANEGIVADLFFTDQPPLLSQGVAAGDLDFALAAPIAAFLNLAGQGSLRVIAANADEAPGFPGLVVVVSNQAYASGLKTFNDLGGHSFAITAAGNPAQYVLAGLAQKHGFDYASVKMMSLGAFPNLVSAVIGGSADFSIPPMSPVREALSRGKLHNIGFVSDEMPMTVTVAFTSGKTADQRTAIVRGFLRAYRAGARDYHDAFIGPDERRHDGPTAEEAYALIAKYIGGQPGSIKSGLSHVDAEGRLAVADIQHQIAWYKSQGMVKPEVDGAKIIDMRYVVPMPEK